jgi:TPR repeat protein
VQAQFAAGRLAATGAIGYVNLDEAARAFLAAARQGHPTAAFNIAVFYATGQGVARDVHEALRWYVFAAEHGVKESEVKIAELYLGGELGPRNYDLARQWLGKAVERGDSNAKTRLAQLYLENDAGGRDLGRAEGLLLDAAGQGSAVAAAQLGQLYSGAYEFTPRRQEAIHWYRTAAQSGHIGAAFTLASALLESGDPVQEKEGAQWLMRAGAEEHAASQFQLGVLYCTGKGVEKDLPEAIGWYEKAARNGHALAKHNLGVMLIKGMGVEVDAERGARLVKEAEIVRGAQAG